ncbi:MFS transporter [Weissella cibaria]|uniref:MFS transporter n=1 Tax=Weissella cibaria TaxID=137591 RepID=UPI0024699DEB|nr:MFS transporter [Weissella cibaria]
MQLFLIQLLSMVTFYSLFVAISPYAVATYHVSTATTGLVAVMMIIGTMIARIFSGLITQHLTAKQITILSMAILLPSLLAYQLELGIWYLLFVRFWQGISAGFTGTVTNNAAARVIPESRLSEGIAYFSLATILGTAFGPFSVSY